jgi:DNA-binding response OmpR family regulator
MAKHVLVVEDDADTRDLLAFNLGEEGYQVSACGDGELGLAKARQLRPDLVILDLKLPGLDGLEICRRLKSDPATATTAVLMLTVRSSESDIVLGLGLGADDYLTKPFRLAELIARVKALLRRIGSAEHLNKCWQYGGLAICPEKHEAVLDGQEIRLTATEFKILECLVMQPGRVFTREELIALAIGEDVTVMESNIDTHICALRRKLNAQRRLIETVWGVGYRLAPLEHGLAST